VSVNGKPAYVYYISPQQINALAPADLPINGPVPVEVNNNGRKTIYNVVLQTHVSPAIFQVPVGKTVYAAATSADGTLLVPAGAVPGAVTRAAKPGETISLYATGLGATNPEYGDGVIPPQPLALKVTPRVVIGRSAARVVYAGLVSPGLYQVNAVVPDVAAAGEYPVLIGTEGLASLASVVIPVAP
jgi:uncharacterized protein (TIGR03437 family)